jgi:indolepyruvate ferredoxin oxidoreductase
MVGRDMTTPVGVTLDDKYTLDRGRIYLTGIQALVRLPMMQRQLDLAAGLNTGGFISGYRGSPLGGYDTALWAARKHLERANIHFQPGLNEDLAATSLWGSQQIGMFPGATVDGVFGIWYGKGPGVDRSMDVLKHANLAGTSPRGGVLAIAGDDHACQSSSIPNSSDQVLVAAMIPVLNPASLQDYLDFGLFGFALSRYSGCWVGFKAVGQTVESSASILVDPDRSRFVLPEDFVIPAGGLGIRWPDPPLEQEARLHGAKMDAVAAFARVNRVDRIMLDSPRPRLAIFTTGKAYADVRQALSDLGIDDARAGALGLRLYKIGLAWPLEPEGARHAASGVEEVLVVEEKRPLIEDQLVKLLYRVDASRRPEVVGKRDETGGALLPSVGELDPVVVAQAVLARLSRLHGDLPELAQRLAVIEAYQRSATAPGTGAAQRLPFFCAGCPHNTSTKLPDGSRATAGIGCHGMVMWMPYRHTAMTTHMGGEGLMWVGQAPFTSESHVFQNLGDGTYTHSGSLAIRAAVAAGVNITYKVLYNDAVAMTGGQLPEGHMSVPQIARQLAAENVQRIAIVTDEVDKYPAVGANFPPGVAIRHRDELDAVQRELRAVPGVTILIYDQTCAAEKRRRRKRGTFPDPDKRVFINDAVCEGCGDCSEQSHCIAVVPLETELGRKRAIDQSSCNKDFSCLKGFCPSFVTVYGGAPRRPSVEQRSAGLPPLAEPTQPSLDQPYSILVTGIGGTGVITIGALLGMAAHLEGKACSILDSTGLAQKNGAVMSHIRLATDPDSLHSVRVPIGGAQLLLGCDMVVAASPFARSRLGSVTAAVLNSHVAPTAAFVTNGDADLEAQALQRTLSEAVGKTVDFVDATRLATRLTGDAIASNLLMLGYAFQRGLVPLSLAAIERAIELNGVAVAANKRALALGRLAAHDRGSIDRMVGAPPARATAEPRLDELVERRARDLVAYQDEAYAARYRRLIAAVAAAELTQLKGREDLAKAAASSLFKLMAYKDEYEVARLFTDGDFLAKLRQQFEGKLRLGFHLAPPLSAQRDPATGELKKREFGPWVFSLFKLLARMKRLRGTAFDVFGYTAERRVERRLVEEYEATLRRLIDRLSPANHAVAVEIARLPLKIRGYGHVKERNLVSVRAEEARLFAAFDHPVQSAAAE